MTACSLWRNSGAESDPEAEPRGRDVERQMEDSRSSAFNVWLIDVVRDARADGGASGAIEARRSRDVNEYMTPSRANPSQACGGVMSYVSVIVSVKMFFAAGLGLGPRNKSVTPTAAIMTIDRDLTLSIVADLILA
jgi:hypothetical protein